MPVIQGCWLANNLNGISQSFFNASQYDSSLAYAKQALTYDYPDYLTVAEGSYELIYKSFDKENKRDSANEYFRLFTEVKDSLFLMKKAGTYNLRSSRNRYASRR